MWKCSLKMTKSSPSVAEKRVVIGRAGAPHGTAGELRILPLTDFPDRFQDMKEVYVGEEILHIETVTVRNEKPLILLRFHEYPTREQAAKLTGKFLSVERADAVPLEEGQYYTFDIVGLEVFDASETSLGYVTEVLQTGSNDVYVVAKRGEAGQILVPALKKVVKEINLPKGRMTVELPEEM